MLHDLHFQISAKLCLEIEIGLQPVCDVPLHDFYISQSYSGAHIKDFKVVCLLSNEDISRGNKYSYVQHQSDHWWHSQGEGGDRYSGYGERVHGHVVHAALRGGAQHHRDNCWLG